MKQMNSAQKKNIVVCLKATRKRNCNERNEFDMGPYDYFALYQALAYKRKYNACIICISMGPMSSQNVLRKCVALGADRAILLADNCFMGSDTYVTSYILSRAIQRIELVDYIFVGMKSLDGETGQVGFEMAAWLDLPINIYDECSIEYFNDNSYEYQSVCLFNHYMDCPALGLFEISRMKNAKIEILNALDLNIDSNTCGFKGSLTIVKESRPIELKRKERILSGSDSEVSSLLLELLHH